MSYLPYSRARGRDWLGAGVSALALHVAAGMGLWWALTYQAGPSQTPPEPAFTVSLQRLDTDTLAGMQLSEGIANGEAGAGREGMPDPAEVVTPEPQATEPQATEPQAPEPQAPEPETPEPETPVTEAPPADPEMPEPEVTPPPVVQNEPSPKEPAAPEPVPEGGETLLPEIASPLLPITSGTGFGGEPNETSPTAPDETLPEEPEAEAQSTQAGAGNAGQSVGPDGTGAVAPRAIDLAAGDLIRRIRETPQPDCMVALPRRTLEGGLGLEMIGASDRLMESYGKALSQTAEEGAPELVQTRRLVDPRQCAVLDFVTRSPNYPATRLGVSLEASTVESGGWLRGGVRGTSGRYVLLMLVDTNGVVQDLQRFSRFGENRADFAVPVTKVGPARDTSQLVLAMASDAPLTELRETLGKMASEVLPVAEKSMTADTVLAITSFDLR